MALPNDLTKIADGVAGSLASNLFTSTPKAASRVLIRETITLVKSAVDGSAAATTAYTAGFLVRMPRACRVLGAAYLPIGAATADATNNATLNVVKGDGLGGAETVAATITTNVAGGSLAAGVVKALTISSTVANTRIPLGGVLAFSIAKGGTGVAVPAGTFTVDVEWEAVDGYGAA